MTSSPANSLPYITRGHVILSTPPKILLKNAQLVSPVKIWAQLCQMRLRATPHFSCPKETHSQDMSRGRSHSRCGGRSWPRSHSTNQACPLELLGKLCKLLGVIACPAGVQYKRGSLAVGLIHQEKDIKIVCNGLMRQRQNHLEAEGEQAIPWHNRFSRGQ